MLGIGTPHVVCPRPQGVCAKFLNRDDEAEPARDAGGLGQLLTPLGLCSRVARGCAAFPLFRWASEHSELNLETSPHVKSREREPTWDSWRRWYLVVGRLLYRKPHVCFKTASPFQAARFRGLIYIPEALKTLTSLSRNQQ